MKKLVACFAGEWAKKLFTIDRYETIDYFIDENDGEFLIGNKLKKIHRFEFLTKENLEKIIIIVTDSRKYDYAKKILTKYECRENVNFFNGWKLNHAFYDIYYHDKMWMDYERENDSALSNMRTGWEKRAQAMVKLIPKNVGSILDIGCGECLLKKYLPREIKYYGLDYRKRNDETIVCNINEEKIPVINGIDLYYLAGVVAYVKDERTLFKQFNATKYVLMSYIRNEKFIRLDNTVIEKGYMNYGNKDYYIGNLISDMAEAGFLCIKMEWDYKIRDEYYLLFARKDML